MNKAALSTIALSKHNNNNKQRQQYHILLMWLITERKISNKTSKIITSVL